MSDAERLGSGDRGGPSEPSEPPVLPVLAEPAIASASPGAFEVPWRRLHPLSPLLRGGIALLIVIGILVANLRDRFVELFFADRFADYLESDSQDVFDLVDYLAKQRLLFWAIAGVLGVVLLIVGFAWLSYRFSSFRITDEAVEARHGVLFRQHRRAPLERIQSVNLQRSLLARVLGLTALDVQTGGQGGKVALQYLGHSDAKRVREQILLAVAASKGTSAAVNASDCDAPPEGDLVDVGAGGSTVAVDHRGQAYSLSDSALEQRFRDLADFDIDPGARESGALIKVPIARLIGSILLSSEMLILLAIVVGVSVSTIWTTPFLLTGLLPVAIVMVGLLIAQFNKGFNFVLSRAADGVRVGAGLTSTTTETIPFGRVHAVMATQPLGWRIFGWYKVRITTAGHSASQAGQNKLQNVVLPVGDIEDVVRVFETLLHDGPEGAEARRVEWHDALAGAGSGFLKAGRRAAWLLLLGTRRAGLRIEHADTEHASLRIRRGWFTRSLSVMPVLRAQSILLHRPPVHRILGLATLTAHTVLGPVRMQMRGIALSDAQLAFDVLEDVIVRVQGAEAERRAGEPSGTSANSRADE